MKIEYVNPFLKAAVDVLEHELGSRVIRETLRLVQSPYSTEEVTVRIGMTGSVTGVVLLCLSEETACNVAGRILGTSIDTFTALVSSGTAELANVIAGVAGMGLAEAGFPSAITHPDVIVGRNTLLSTLDFPRVVIPLRTVAGSLELHVALKSTNLAGDGAGLPVKNGRERQTLAARQATLSPSGGDICRFAGHSYQD